MPTRAAVLLCRLSRRRKVNSLRKIILVIRLDGLGDCVMTQPLLQELRRCYPDATMMVAMQAGWVSLFENLTYVDCILPFKALHPEFLPKSAHHFYSAMAFYLEHLHQHRFDIVINPRWDADCYLGTMLCALTRAPLTLGYEDSTSAWKRMDNPGFQSAYNHLIKAGPLQHEVLRNLHVLRALGYEPEALFPSLEVTDENNNWRDTWIGARRNSLLLVLGLPAAAGQRRWSAANYIDTLHLVRSMRDMDILLLADAATLAVAEVIRAEFSNSSLAMEVPLTRVAALIQSADIYLGCDSGLAHVAAALGRTTLILSAHPVGADAQHANSPQRFRPYGENTYVLQPKGRAGCEAYCNATEPHCILDLSPQQVAALILKMMRPELPDHSSRKTPLAALGTPSRLFHEEIMVSEPESEWINVTRPL